MPKYNGTTLDLIQPQLKSKTYPEISDADALSWFNELVTGLKKDEALGINVNEGQNLYYLDDSGKFQPATFMENINDPACARDLMRKSMDGRLFTRELGEPDPKQVITQKTAPFDLGVSPDSLFADLSNPEPVAPNRPNIFKRLLAPLVKSFREQVDEYNQKKAEYDDLVTQHNWVSKLRYSDNGAGLRQALKLMNEDADLEKLTPEYKAREAKKAEAAKNLSAKEAARKEFWAELHADMKMAKNYVSMEDTDFRLDMDYNNAFFSGSAEKIYGFLATQLVAAMAKGVLDQAAAVNINDKAGSNTLAYAFLDKTAPIYRAAKQDLIKAMPNLVGNELRESIEKCVGGDGMQLYKIPELMRNFLKTGVNKYTEFLNQQNAAAKEQEQPAIQAQQPNLEQQAPAMSGPSI